VIVTAMLVTHTNTATANITGPQGTGLIAPIRPVRAHERPDWHDRHERHGRPAQLGD
jgi:hypothetical protein